MTAAASGKKSAKTTMEGGGPQKGSQGTTNDHAFMKELDGMQEFLDETSKFDLN